MTLSAADGIAVFILSAIGAGIGSYLTAYLKRKGENLATHEDIEKLVNQVRATTEATENIRTALTGTLWESQERWKMKSEMYLSFVRNLRFCEKYWLDIVYAREHYEQGTRALEDAIVRIEYRNDALRQARTNIDDADGVASIINPRLNETISTLWREVEEVDISFAASAREGAGAYRRALTAVIAESRADLRVAPAA
jgi:hypothetical protein